MKTIQFFLFLILSSPLFSQNWVQVGDINDTPRVMLSDSVSGLLYLSGNFRFNGIDTVDGFCAYDGTSFTSFGRRFDCASFGCNPAFMIARYQENLYFSGSSLSIIDGVADINGIAQWDGTKWSPAMQGLYYDEDDNPYLDGYYIHEGNFYGVGFFRTAEGDTCNSVAFWDGQKWTGLGFIPYSDNGLPRVFNVIFYQDQLYVAGNFSWEIGGGGDIARLTSNGWEMVGGGLKGGLANVFDMVEYKGELYICGRFNKFDGNVGSGIMRWDGDVWREVGSGFCNPAITAAAMMVYKDKLYVVGIFDCVNNNILASNIASWDGERWCTLGGSYFNNGISCIAEYKGEIYVGGGFTKVDGQPCRSLAKYIGDNSNEICSTPVSAAPEPAKNGFKLSPNPTSDLLEIQAPSPMESVWIYDAVGRAVLQPGVFGLRASVSVGDLPAGLYFVSVRAGGWSWSGKFVRQ